MKKTYQTEQKKRLINFLKREKDKQYTIEEIAEHFEGSIGKSTIYRLMNQYVEDGDVKRFVKGNGRHFFYQLVDGHTCTTHFHLKCVDCGRLIHVEDELSDDMMNKVMKTHLFEIDESKTMLYGHCNACIYENKEKTK